MACSKCKNKNKNKDTKQSDITYQPKGDIVKSFLDFVVKFILFIITGFVLTIIVIPFSLYLLFKALFLDGTVNVEQILTRLNMINKNTKEISS
jgi:lipopolysaccharide/colanic/teichoic acid biosynthesis glycosyltransferase